MQGGAAQQCLLRAQAPALHLTISVTEQCCDMEASSVLICILLPEGTP